MKARKNRRECGATTIPQPGPTREVIARLAELLWEREGRPAGGDAKFRLRAKAELSRTNEPIRDESKP